MFDRAFKNLKTFGRVESGVVLIEALIAVPAMTFFTIGILEFGNMMWQRQQLQVGVRDAARYWTRCRPQEATGTGTTQTYMPCSVDIAENIAFFGFPNANPATSSRRVPGWTSDTQLTISPATPPLTPSATDVVRVTGEANYAGSPLFGWILEDALTIEYSVEMRYIGW